MHLHHPYRHSDHNLSRLAATRSNALVLSKVQADHLFTVSAFSHSESAQFSGRNGRSRRESPAPSTHIRPGLSASVSASSTTSSASSAPSSHFDSSSVSEASSLSTTDSTEAPELHEPPEPIDSSNFPEKQNNLREPSTYRSKYRSLLAPLDSFSQSSRASIKSFCSSVSLSTIATHNSLATLSKRRLFRSNPRSAPQERLTLATLPADILDLIFAELPQRDLVCMLYVCRALLEPARRRLYHWPYFTTSYRFAQFVTLISQNEQLAGCVHVLDLSHIELGIVSANGDSVDPHVIMLADWRDWKFRHGGPVGIREVTPEAAAFPRLPWRQFRNPFMYADGYGDSETEFLTPVTTAGSSGSRAHSASGISAFRKHHKSLPGSKDSRMVPAGQKHRFGHPSGLRRIRRLISVRYSPSVPTVASRRPPKQEIGSARLGTSLHDEQLAARAPFSTPHPQQNTFFVAKYAGTKDVPVGAILHVFRHCRNLRAVNLSGVHLTNDYEIIAKEQVDRFLPLVRETYRSGPKPVLYVSDVPKSNTWKPEEIQRVNREAIVESICASGGIRELNLSNLMWINTELVQKLCQLCGWVKIDLCGSGMVRDMPWAISGDVEVLREKLPKAV